MGCRRFRPRRLRRRGRCLHPSCHRCQRAASLVHVRVLRPKLLLQPLEPGPLPLQVVFVRLRLLLQLFQDPELLHLLGGHVHTSHLVGRLRVLEGLLRLLGLLDALVPLRLLLVRLLRVRMARFGDGRVGVIEAVPHSGQGGGVCTLRHFPPLQAVREVTLHPHVVRDEIHHGAAPGCLVPRAEALAPLGQGVRNRLDAGPPEVFQHLRELEDEAPVELRVIEVLLVVGGLQEVALGHPHHPGALGVACLELEPDTLVRHDQSVVVVQHHAALLRALRIEAHLDAEGLSTGQAPGAVAVHHLLAEGGRHALCLDLLPPQEDLHPRHLVQNGEVGLEGELVLVVQGCPGAFLLPFPAPGREELDIGRIAGEVELVVPAALLQAGDDHDGTSLGDRRELHQQLLLGAEDAVVGDGLKALPGGFGLLLQALPRVVVGYHRHEHLFRTDVFQEGPGEEAGRLRAASVLGEHQGVRPEAHAPRLEAVPVAPDGAVLPAVLLLAVPEPEHLVQLFRDHPEAVVHEHEAALPADVPQLHLELRGHHVRVHRVVYQLRDGPEGPAVRCRVAVQELRVHLSPR